MNKTPFILSSIFVLVASFVFGIGGSYVGLQLFTDEVQQQNVVQTQVLEEESALIDVFESSENAVVSVIIKKDVPVYETNYVNPFEGFGGFAIPQQEQVGTEEQQVGAGSGFFVSSDGLIVTNRHVVEDPDATYSVIMNDGEVLDAEVVDIDTVYDIAVIQVEGDDFDYLELANSEDVKVGQRVLAIGNALGEFSNTLSSGIVSGLDRSITASSGYGQAESLFDIIQTDASINRGNSGGPLLNYAGQVIGVNVAVAQNAENIGFAIPINPVSQIIDSVKQYGEIRRAYLGVRYVELNPAMQEANALDYDYGALILRGKGEEDLAVIPGSPADKAGLEENNIILEVNGVKIDSSTSLVQELSKYEIGKTVELKVYVDGEEKTVEVTLEESPL